MNKTRIIFIYKTLDIGNRKNSEAPIEEGETLEKKEARFYSANSIIMLFTDNRMQENMYLQFAERAFWPFSC